MSNPNCPVCQSFAHTEKQSPFTSSLPTQQDVAAMMDGGWTDTVKTPVMHPRDQLQPKGGAGTSSDKNTTAGNVEWLGLYTAVLLLMVVWYGGFFLAAGIRWIISGPRSRDGTATRSALKTPRQIKQGARRRVRFAL